MLESVRHNVSITDRVKQTKYLYFADRNVKYYCRIQWEFESFLSVFQLEFCFIFISHNLVWIFVLNISDGEISLPSHLAQALIRWPQSACRLSQWEEGGERRWEERRWGYNKFISPPIWATARVTASLTIPGNADWTKLD